MTELSELTNITHSRRGDAPRPPIDPRFRALMAPADWSALPCAVRTRFSKQPAHDTICYVGTIVECRMSGFGWLLAQACRIVGAPLPLSRDTGGAAIVSVTEDGATGGQVWTRVYARRRGFPQVIHSAKRFTGPTGLEEYLGAGFGVALVATAQSGRLIFSSDHCYVVAFGFRARLPRWLAPDLSVAHVDHGDGSFDFILSLRHRLLGELIHQVGIFRDCENEGDA